MTICRQCKEEKESAEFYKSNRTQCKECVKMNVRKNRKERIDYYRDYEKRRAHKPERLKSRGVSKGAALICHIPKHHHAYPKFSAGHRTISLLRCNKKQKARDEVWKAVKRGDLFKSACVFCGEKHAQGHHEDYTKPLDVIWLCPVHHKAVHAGKIKIYPAVVA